MLLKLVLYILLPLAFCQQKCFNNATYIQKQDFCICTAGYIGQSCNITSYQLNDTQVNIPINNNNWTFAYYKPEQKIIYRILLTFCSVNKTQQLSFIVFVQQEQKNGQIQLSPKKQRDTLQIDVGGTEGCKQVLSTVLVSMDRKPNDQIVRIIFGFQLLGKKLPADATISIKCETNSIFTVSFLGTILISFLVIVTVFLIISIIFLLRRRFLQIRNKKRQDQKKKESINKIMPSQKYEDLNQQKTSQYDINCSICLCQFQKGQDIRKTPCGHIYHASCLDSWCNSNLNCPICRQNFQKQQELAVVQESLRADNTNIRQPIL